MKEATGELNMTIIVSISIGILAAFFFGFLWPIINNNFHRTSQCKDALCDCSQNVRDSIEGETGKKNMCSCQMRDTTNTNYYGTEVFYCPFKG